MQNQQIKCLVLDDEPLAVDLMVNHINNLEELDLVYTTNNPVEAMKFINENEIDLAFFDIQMPLLTGIELVKNLKRKPHIIFTTAYRDFAVESYELDVVDYLVKPITFSRFLKSVEKFKSLRPNTIATDKNLQIEEIEKSSSSEFTFFNVGRRHEKVLFMDILYIEGMREYVRIFMNDSSIMTKMSVTDIEKILPSHFSRIHRSYIINIDQMSAYTNHDVEIAQKKLPIGGSYKEAFLKKIRNI